jgi:lichenan operon transcriptional antiterminator
LNSIERQQEIINLLRFAPDYTSTAKELAEKLNVSSKTIRNDILQMNQQVKQPIILSKAGKGYELTSLAMNIETPVKEDVRFLLLSQMIEKQSVDIFDLADSLYVSESTLDRLVKELNIVITEQDKQLLIKRKNNQLFIKGEEVEKRKLFNIFLNQ